MSDLILPGATARGDLTILVPQGYERPATGECFLCGEMFAPGDNVVAHMKKCVTDAGHDHRQDHEDRKERLAIFYDREAWDPEVEDHLRKVGQRMLKEGRWEVKPNERAGFS